MLVSTERLLVGALENHLADLRDTKLSGDRTSVELGIPMADAITLTAARSHSATL